MMVLVLLLSSAFSQAQTSHYDTTPQWPVDDVTMAATFGPRHSGSPDVPDWHRGIDLSTTSGDSVSHIVGDVADDCEVRDVELDGGLYDVEVRCERPGASKCSTGGGCYWVLYKHLESVDVADGDSLVQGDAIGTARTGTLHLGLLDGRAAYPKEGWARTAAHPLELLSYTPGAVTGSVSIVGDDVVVDIDQAASTLHDVYSIEVEVDQGGVPAASRAWSMRDRNYDWSHSDSKYPGFWEAFGENGDHECQYWSEHGASYEKDLHLLKAGPDPDTETEHDGIRVKHFDQGVGQVYEITVTFVGLADLTGTLSAEAVVKGATGNTLATVNTP